VGAAIGNRFTLALAVYTPSFERASYPATSDGEQPTRYHAIEIDLRNVALVPALAFRIGNDLRIGVAPGFLFSTARLVFDEDTGLTSPTLLCGGTVCPRTPGRRPLRRGLGPGRVRLHPLVHRGRRPPLPAEKHRGGGLLHQPAAGQRWRRRRGERRPDHGDAPAAPGPGGGGLPARSSPGLRLGPHPLRPARHLHGRVSRGTSPRPWPITAIVRWLTFSQHQQIGIRVVGPANGGLRTARLPERIVLTRGFQDVFEGRVRSRATSATGCAWAPRCAPTPARVAPRASARPRWAAPPRSRP
jgi:hypothetical protein